MTPEWLVFRRFEKRGSQGRLACLFCLGRDTTSTKPPGTVLLPGRPGRITNPSSVYEMRAELHVDTSSLECEVAVRRADRA
jgi:hypothetical protein